MIIGCVVIGSGARSSATSTTIRSRGSGSRARRVALVERGMAAHGAAPHPPENVEPPGVPMSEDAAHTSVCATRAAAIQMSKVQNGKLKFAPAFQGTPPIHYLPLFVLLNTVSGNARRVTAAATLR